MRISLSGVQENKLYIFLVRDAIRLSFSTNRSVNQVQSTLVIWKSKGPTETLRDIRTSTYHMCIIEENTNQTTKFHKYTCNLTPLVRNLC